MAMYRSPALRQLKDLEIERASIDERLQQVDRAERLLNELQPGCTYRIPALVQSIIGSVGNEFADQPLSAEDAMHDLRCFVEDLSSSADITLDAAGEEVWTVDDLCRRYMVSAKTVARWRDKGLVSRRFRIGGRKRLGFLQSSVERFLAKHRHEVERGSNFSQVSDEEREKLVERARQLALAGGRPTEISHRLARHFGRSPETVRYTLKNFDKENPAKAIFAHDSHDASHDVKREIYQRYLQGTDVGTLARLYQRTRTGIFHLVTAARAEQILNQPIDYVDAPEFHRPDADKVILAPAPPTPEKPALRKAPPGLSTYLSSLYSIPLLSRDEELYYFRKMNYLKFQASEMREAIDPAKPKKRDMDQVERLNQRANEVKNFLIRSNLRLVVSIAKKRNPPAGTLFDLISDGNISLIRAIEKFDFTRGFKFSTYATWAIIKNFARSIPTERAQYTRFRTGSDEILTNSLDRRSHGLTDEMDNRRQHEWLMGVLSRLSEREQDILVSRYGLRPGLPPQTLEQVGAKLGVTKERVRQLVTKSLMKLRKIVDMEAVDVPGV